MGITDLITGGIGSKAVSAISGTLGVSETKAKWIMAAAVPLMIAALNYNSKKNKDQAENIDKALDQHSSSGILDKVSDSFSGGNTSDDGNKIVQHIFGKNTESVTQNLADKAGISTAQVGTVLASLAPLVMGYLGQQKQSSGSGIGDLIGSIFGGGGNAQQAGGSSGIGDLIGSIFGGGGNTPAQQGSTGTDALGNLAGDFFNQQDNGKDKGGILDSIASIFGK